MKSINKENPGYPETETALRLSWRDQSVFRKFPQFRVEIQYYNQLAVFDHAFTCVLLFLISFSIF